MSTSMSVLFFGRRSVLSMRVLQELSRQFRVVGVIESHFRGFRPERGLRKWLRPVPPGNNIARFARENGLPYFLLTPERIGELTPFIAAAKPDLGVISGLAQLLSPAVISQFPQGILNTHPSLLPCYRGPDPLFWMYYHEEKTGGVSVHFIDSGEDTGDLVKQAEMPISFGESGRRLLQRCAEVAAPLVVDAVREVAEGKVVRVPQAQWSCPFRARKLRPGENPIAWTEWPIERVYHVLCGAVNHDLLPRRPFPFSVARWEVVGFDHRAQPSTPPQFSFSRLRCFVLLPSGRIWLRPRFSWEQAERGLKDFLRPLLRQSGLRLPPLLW